MKTAFRVLCITEKAGLPTSAGSTRPLFSHLCHSAEKCGTAWSLLRGLREEGHAIPVSAINVILESLNALDKTEEAYRYYHKLHQLTTSGPNLETINTMLQGLRRTPSPTTSIPTSSDPSSPIPSSPSTTPKQKALTLARSLLNHNLKANALTYDHLVRICLLPSSFETAKEDYEDAFRYLEEMEQVGRHAKGEIWWMSAGTANRMVEVCVEMGDLERVRRVLGEMERRGVDVRAGVREMVARLEGDGD
jgi:pentatricopeptide repeat protein